MPCTGCQRRKAKLIALGKKVKAVLRPKPRVQKVSTGDAPKRTGTQT